MTRTLQFKTADGLSLAGEIGGDPNAPTLILLHGGAQTRHSWAASVLRFIGEGYQVVTYDARGHGESDWSPDGKYSIQQYADDLYHIIETLDGPVGLVGASMGGMASFYVAASRRPPKIRALVLVDIVLRPSSKGRDRILGFVSSHPDGFATLDEAVDVVAQYNPHRPRPADPSGLMKNLRLRENGRLCWHWDPRLFVWPAGTSPSPAANALMEMAPNVKIPTLIVRGEESDIVDDANIEEMRAVVPHLEVCNVAGAGHMLVGDKNDTFSDAVAPFLTRHLRSKNDGRQRNEKTGYISM